MVAFKFSLDPANLAWVGFSDIFMARKFFREDRAADLVGRISLDKEPTRSQLERSAYRLQKAYAFEKRSPHRRRSPKWVPLAL